MNRYFIKYNMLLVTAIAVPALLKVLVPANVGTAETNELLAILFAGNVIVPATDIPPLALSNPDTIEVPELVKLALVPETETVLQDTVPEAVTLEQLIAEPELNVPLVPFVPLGPAGPVQPVYPVYPIDLGFAPPSGYANPLHRRNKPSSIAANVFLQRKM